MNKKQHTQAGASLIEMTSVVVLLTMGVLGSLNVMDRGGAFVSHTSSRLKTDEANRLSVGSIERLITETAPEFIDTSMRIHDPSSSDYHSDRFIFSDMNYSQCLSPLCRFHTDGSTRLGDGKYQAGLEFRSGNGLTSVMRGKVWPGYHTKCPLDGYPTASIATLDCVKFFSARGAAGTFKTSGGVGPGPAWSTLVILAPYAQTSGHGQLRGYTIEMADLLAGVVSSSGTSPFDLEPPDMVKLFDFGKDGTTDGVPDGSVPVTPEQSDAETEFFFAGDVNDGPAVVIHKNLGSSGSYPWRTLTIIVELEDGTTQFSVSHYESASVYWTAARIFKRVPTKLVNNLTEFAVSTARSNPYEAATNPDGVREDGVVRLTIGTSDEIHRKGEKEWSHGVETLVLRPRN